MTAASEAALAGSTTMMILDNGLSERAENAPSWFPAPHEA